LTVGFILKDKMCQCQCFGVQIAFNIRLVIYQIRMLTSHGGIPFPIILNGFLLVSIVSTVPCLTIIIGIIGLIIMRKSHLNRRHSGPKISNNIFQKCSLQKKSTEV